MTRIRLNWMVFGAGILVLPALAGYSPYDPPLDSSLIPSRAGMKAYSEVFKGVASNSINTTTPGYRAMKGNIVNNNGDVEVQIYRSPDKGAGVETKRPLDLLIEGTGFFTVQMPFGIVYTRDGRFDVERDGTLVTQTGRYPILTSDHSPIKLTTSKVIISKNGTIVQDDVSVGTIGITAFTKEAPLRSLGGIYFYMKDADVNENQIQPLYTIRQGFYEDSNVNLSEEMVKIPVFKDEHDANSKAAKTVLKSLQTAAAIGRSN